ncbi:MAG: Ig-like domain-containing protein [Oscillospiraceae bacterium]|nr:Ig-like domain-containing protein [Oscillospiraceae bacterium]
MKTQWTGLLLSVCLLLPAPLPARASFEPLKLEITAPMSEAAPPAIPATGDKWDGVSISQPTKLVEKDGTDSYEITKCAELAFVAQTGGVWLGKNYVLANNLILNDMDLACDAEGRLSTVSGEPHGWTPIGDSGSSPFTGNFDGGGYAISGLCVERDAGDTGLFGFSRGTIKDLVVVNAYVRGTDCVGGVAGAALSDCSGCVFHGAVFGSGDEVGGVAGRGLTVSDCVNYGSVTGGGACIGGVAGSCTDCSGCANYGAVFGSGDRIGGVVGCVQYAACTDSANHGAVTGGNCVGGVAGSCFNADVSGCVNNAAVDGADKTGGIVGECSASNDSDVALKNNANRGAVSCTKTAGGIAGILHIRCTIANCCNTGDVTGAESKTGGVVGTVGTAWDDDTITGCYYLKTAAVNTNLQGYGTYSGGIEPKGFRACGETELLRQTTYENWDFQKIWRINPRYNDGYPYLAWERGGAPELTGISLNKSELTLFQEQKASLSVSPIPAGADLATVRWTSNDTRVADVSSDGLVMAGRPGTATITARTGEYSAACVVTVKPRAMEYQIGTLTVKDASGEVQTIIPNGKLKVGIPIEKSEEGGDATVILAYYSSGGRFLGALSLDVTNLPPGTGVELSIPVDNSDGRIAEIKVFVAASLANPIPVGVPASFPAN